MFIKANRFPVLQVPAGATGHDAIAAIIAAPARIGWNEIPLALLKPDVCDRQIIGIFRKKGTPCTEHNAEVLRK